MKVYSFNHRLQMNKKIIKFSLRFMQQNQVSRLLTQFTKKLFRIIVNATILKLTENMIY